ncbi:glycosyltransferase family 2 protein [Candidatus Woesearchaeota archaeon]|nr:glycosyltransferase family 2 protein [Candidatus Woesearchaeota archaeon]
MLSLLTLTSVLFFILFLFLLFIFLVFLVSFFRRPSYPPFEPNVSIVIPAYNEAGHIRDCLASVLASAYPKKKMEVIVVDDGSTDSTREIVKRFPAVKLISSNHGGKTEALNAGTREAKHPFILTLDADTIVDGQCMKRLVRPLSDASIAATTGSSKVRDPDSVLDYFQNIEYHYNNLIRRSFSDTFSTGVWFFGALACYRKDVLKKIGLFKKDTLTEDMDISLEIHRAGFRTVHVYDAFCFTIVPKTLKELYSQRSRWWMGVLQALRKNKALFSKKMPPSIFFLYLNQYWWSIYAFLSFPVIIYQILYWLPYNQDTLFHLTRYLFNWFTLAGPFYVLYKIPEWGFTFNNAFGVLSGIISAIMILASILMFKDKYSFKNLLALFFYFPYTIVLNTVIVLSLLAFGFRKERYFIR